MSQAAELAAVLFVATALLCLYAEVSRRPLRQRIAMVLALITVTAADAAMLRHDPALGLSWEGAGTDRPSKARRRDAREHDGSGGDGEARADKDRPDGGGSRSMADDEDGGEGDDGEEEVRLLPSRSWDWSRLAALLPSLQSGERTEPLPASWDTIRDCPACPEMIVLPAGDTVIGAPAADREATAAEQPARRVRVWPGFAIARFEISVVELGRAGMAPPPSSGTCAGRTDEAMVGPATCLTWQEASRYAAWLSAVSGHRYRLPSAAEWEYAARLASAPRQVASADAAALPVGPLPEAMGGGVAEFVGDCWADTLENGSETASAFRPNRACWNRMLKDGADGEGRRWRRPSARRPIEPGIRSPDIGFRVVRELAGESEKRP